ncbi:MAG: penicillin-binding protein [Chitinophagales bacterium]|nr:penicillin-binding protein [Chitinophagales bacterium]
MNFIKKLLSPKYLWGYFIAAIAFVSLFFLFVRLGLFGKLPTFDEIENPNSNLASEIYSADSVLIGKYYVNNRSNIAFSDLSPWSEKALLAIEDERFYNHSGVDLESTFRAIVFMGSRGGGSTITQQLAKMMFHRRPSNLVTRVIQKLKEYILALMIERRYTKEEIIAMYYNMFDFTYNAVGIESASRIYFNKKPRELNIDEAAIFAGMAQNPILHNPKKFPENAKKRRNTVLYKMRELGYITNTQYEQAINKPIKLDYHPESANDGIAPYFRTELSKFLKQWAKDNPKSDGTTYNIYTDGLKIYTTIDSRLQQHAEAAVIEHLKKHQNIIDAQFKSGWNPWNKEIGKKILLRKCKETEHWYALKQAGWSDKKIEEFFKNDKREMELYTYNGMKKVTASSYDSVKHYQSMLQAGFMVTEPFTGFVRAWVGGPNYQYFKFDHCTNQRQVGSTFKPIVYTLAVDNGWSPCMVITPGNGCIGSWCPRGGSGGPQTLKMALTKSNNKAAAYITLKFGVKALIDMARRMGITSDLPPYGPICLGAADISLIEMMQVYSTFPNAGINSKPIYIVRIEDKDGNVIQNFTTEMKEVLNDNIAYKMVEMMKGPVGPGGTGASLKGKFGLSGIEIAGKTGTTNNNTDAWFIGYTPQLVAGAWVGCDEPIIHILYTGNGMGSAAAMPIFGKFMNKAYNDKSIGLDKQAKFFKPSNEQLLKSVCDDDEVEIQLDDSGNWLDAPEENYDTEYNLGD